MNYNGNIILAYRPEDNKNPKEKGEPFREKLKIFKQHPILILWLPTYFIITWAILGFTPMGFIITLITYIITIRVALSNTIETIMRHIEDVRHLAVSKEKERLIPLYEEVYEKVKKETPEISKDIKLYIIDHISVNAFALGQNTIAITRGLIEVMDDEEIKGILAHEMGHMTSSDPTVQALITIGSTIYLWGFLIIRYILQKIEKISTTSEGQTSLARTMLGIIIWVIDFGIKVITLIGTLLLMAESRGKEYKADEYASKLGYVYELKQALYKLYDLQISDKRTLIERIKASHPRIAYRIEKLEELESKYITE